MVLSMGHPKLFLTVLILLVSLPSWALEPSEVAVVANSFVSDSVDLARYYMEKRGIPKENLIRIDTTIKEACSREDYDEEIAEPVREFLYNRQGGGAIRCLVTVFGVPLKVGAPEITRAEKKELELNKQELAVLREELKKLTEPKGDEANRLQQRIAALEAQIKEMNKDDQGAAVDSELALVLAGDYPLKGWVANPYFAGYQQQKLPLGKGEVLMVARLDGPTEKIVRRIIDDSLATEAVGLKGTAYFDARWAKPGAQKKLEGYAYYDNSLHLAAERVKSSRKMTAVVNDKEALFQPGEAPGAALYAGWYSLARYIDAFDWQRGAVGYHIASSECVTLRDHDKLWCKRMLEDGVAATIGPVSEPYLQAFPVPEIFFGILMDGYYTLAEAYFLSLPYLSWQMVLVGDPLYRPFKNKETRVEKRE
jgi:uncharacterized protein (TIGR03790 family)